MKRCPECRRDYYDDTLLYCLDDGNALLEGPASRSEPPASAGGQVGDEPQTAILSEPGAGGVPAGASPSGVQVATEFPASESPTHAQVNTTDQTEILRTGAKAEPSMRKWLAIAAAAVVLIIGGIGLAIYNVWPKTDKPSQAMSIERLTTNGKTRDAAISPDGKYVVYILDEGGQQSLWTRQVATTSNVQIIPPADVQYSGLVFSPDSNYINFVVRERPDVPLSVFQMPLLGGTRKKLISNVSSGVAYDPEGKHIAFVRHEFPAADESSLLIANSDGSGERVLATLKRPEFFATGQIPAWSPDGMSIASPVLHAAENEMKVVEVQVADGSVKSIAAFLFIRRIAWLTDKSGILVLGAEKLSGMYNQQIWSISYPDGEVRRITTDTNLYVGMGLTADSGTLAAVQFNWLSNIWVVPNGDAGKAMQIRSGGNNLDGIGSLAWTPDGKIVFYSLASGTLDIWIMNADGSGHRQLTAESGSNFEAAVTPDGRYVVYTSAREEGATLWRMDPDGGNPMRLASDRVANRSTVTPDSRWVIYNSLISGNWRLSKVSIDGGEPVQLTDYHSRNAKVSPDGKLIACEYRKDISSPWRYAIIPFEGGEPLKIFDLPGRDRFRWSMDSRSLIYNDTRGGVGNIWSFPLDGSPPKQLTNFKTELIYNFDLSADGKNLVVARGTTTSDVVLISNFR